MEGGSGLSWGRLKLARALSDLNSPPKKEKVRRAPVGEGETSQACLRPRPKKEELATTMRVVCACGGGPT